MSQYVKKIRTEAGDLQIDYNALANLPTISNPNLLINADFRNPVNQRGKSFYEEQTERYGIDRWLIYNGVKEEVRSGFITLENTFNQESWFGQAFEHPLNNNESYVITVDVGTIIGDVDVCISNQYDSTVRHTLKYGINTFVVHPNEMTSNMERLIFTLGAGAAVDLCYVKLEQGTTATPFVPRLYGEELSLCQRYYQYYDTIDVAANGTYENMKYFSGFIFPTKMRVAPTITAHYENTGNTVTGVLYHAYDYGIGDFHHADTTLNGLAVKMLKLDAEIY